MNRRFFVEGLREYGEMVNVKTVARYLGVDRHTASQILNGVPYIKLGNSKKYTVDDVADAILGRRTI